MRQHLLSVITIMSLLFNSCGQDAPAVEAEVQNEAAVQSGQFQPVADALAAEGSAAQIGGLLMQRFSSVSDQNGILNQVNSQDFVNLAVELSDRYPSDTLAALPLYKAAELARSMNDPKRAAVLYERVHDNYGSFSKAPEALFMAAFTYDEHLDNLDKARETYEKFLKLYPDNVFAKDTPMLLDNLGKSDEEILRQLEEKAGN